MSNYPQRAIAAGVCICGLFTLSAQERSATAESNTKESNSLEFVRMDSATSEIIKKARPIEPNAIPTPNFAIATKDKNFVMSIGGQINAILGYDLGNNLYSQPNAGISFVTGDIPVPARVGHKADFYINPINGFVDFSVVGLANTENAITGYVKLGTNGVTPGVALTRAYITWRNFTFGEKLTLMQDEYACQPPTIDPEGPCGDVSTVSYLISYNSPNYNGFRYAASLEMPTYYASNGVYRGKDYAKYYGKQVDASVEQLVPDIPMWVEYQASAQNRVRATGIIRNFGYRDLVADKHRNVVGWGTMLSGNFSFWKPLTFDFQAVYGKGIGNYIQDIAGRQISFTPKNSESGKLQANEMMGLVFGASYNATSKLQFNAVGSMTRIWGVKDYAILNSNDNYKSAVYVAANCFYTINSYLQWGIEYLYGHHQTWNMGGADDSRVQTQLSFTF